MHQPRETSDLAAAGNRAVAAQAYGELRAIWHRADANLPALAEATRYLR